VLDIGALAGHSGGLRATINSGLSTSSVRMEYVTDEYFEVLEVPLALGRTFDRNHHNAPSDQMEVILSHSLWQKSFGQTPDVVGKTIWIYGRPCIVVGIAPEAFIGLEPNAIDAWLPMEAATAVRTAVWPLARVRAGDSLEKVIDTLKRHYPSTNSVSVPRSSGDSDLVEIQTLPADLAARSAGTNGVLIYVRGGGIAVFLIACLNVGTLMLNRTLRRSREVVIRMQLGATWPDIVRLFSFEAILLTIGCAAVALVFLLWMIPVFARMAGIPKGVLGPLWSPTAVLITGGLALLAVILATVYSLRYFRAVNIAQWLRNRHPGDSKELAAQNTLILAQVCLTVVLAMAAGVFIRSVLWISTLDLGMTPDKVLLATLSDHESFPRPDLNVYYQSMLRRIQTATGRSASLAMTIPFRGNAYASLDSPINNGAGSGPHFNAVTPDYFRTLGIRVIEGRGFLDTDDQSSNPVAIVNDVMARQNWSDESPIGKCVTLRMDGKCRYIVGVVHRTHDRINRMVAAARPGDNGNDGQPGFYLPLVQWPNARVRGLLVTLKQPAEPSDAEALQEELRTTLPDLSYVTVEKLSSIMDDRTTRWLSGTALFASFSFLGLFLAAMAIYNVLTFALEQRTFDMGVRLCLGATYFDIVGLMLIQGMRPVVLGTTLGLLASFAIEPVFRRVLLGASQMDSSLVALIMSLVIGVGFLACMIPALRIVRIDPVRSLRT